MSNMQIEISEAFRALDIPEEKAMRAASALSRRDDDVTTLKADVAPLRWMTGFLIALQLAVTVKLFIQ